LPPETRGYSAKNTKYTLVKVKGLQHFLGTENGRSIRPEKPALKMIRNLVNQLQTPMMKLSSIRL